MPGHLSNVVSLVVTNYLSQFILYGLSYLVSYVYVVVYDFLQLERMISLVKIYFIFRLYECRRFLVLNTGHCEIVLFAYERRALIDISFSKINIVYWSVHDYVKIKC